MSHFLRGGLIVSVCVVSIQFIGVEKQHIKIQECECSSFSQIGLDLLVRLSIISSIWKK